MQLAIFGTGMVGRPIAGKVLLLPIWLRLFGALQTPMFNFKIVR